MNVIDMWESGLSSPLSVMTSLAPAAGLTIYQQRIKIEQIFRDLKTLLGFDKVMNRRARWMEQTLALVALAFIVGLVIGELLRDRLFGKGLPQDSQPNAPAPEPPSRKWQRCSGLFLLLKLKVALSPDQALALLSAVRFIFQALLPPVRSPVRI